MSEDDKNLGNNFDFAQKHPGLVTLRYTVMRIMLLVGFYVIFAAAGLRDFVLLISAFGASGLVSLYLLRRQRDNMSVGITSLFSKVNRRIEKSKSAEDVD